MESKRPGNDEIVKLLDSSIRGLDTQRYEGLLELKSIQKTKNKVLEKEKMRLEEKYGAGHPRIKKLADRIEYNIGVFRDLDAEIENAGIEIPDFDTNTWMIHGRVMNKAGEPVSGMNVSLFDESGNWNKSFGYTCSDDKGYFVLRYQVKDKSEPAAENYYLTLMDENKNLIHQDSQALTVQIGMIDYREIVVEDFNCIPPETDYSDLQNGAINVPPDAWVVYGKVQYADNQPAARVTVSLYDQDLLFDDALGSVMTDDSGQYKVIYREDAFRDLFESKPDIYLKVLDMEGNQLYKSKRIKCEAGKVEELNVSLKKNKADVYL